MKINVFKILQLINMGMEVAESFKGKKGKEKLDHAVDVAETLLPAVEHLVGKDLLKDERVRPFAERYINAAIDLKNVVEAVQGLKADPVPANPS